MDTGAQNYRRYLEGDQAAFDAIIEELYRPLVFFLRRFCGDMETAEDVAMDVFAELVLHRHRYNFKVSLKTYLFMLGKSRVLNQVRRRRFVSDTPIEDVLMYRTDGETPEEAQIRTDREKALHEAMAKLPEDMQTALYLSYFEDMTYEEIARVMKKNKKQVDNLLYRGKERLRELLEEWK